jgi:hypothetical protein
MPWTMTTTDGSLDVKLAEGMRGPEWPELLEAIIQELTAVDRVRFTLPPEPEDPGYVQPINDLIRILTARGVDVDRRTEPEP